MVPLRGAERARVLMESGGDAGPEPEKMAVTRAV